MLIKLWSLSLLVFSPRSMRGIAAWMIVSCLLVLAMATIFVSSVSKLDAMKLLTTLVALLVSTAAVAQFPALPWNPDENGDQIIGLPDLLGLLTVYGQEFENAIVAEDGESAIMYMGDMGLLQCDHACQNLPGFWNMPSPPDLAPVIADVQTAWIAIDWSQEALQRDANVYEYPFFDTGKIRSTQFIDSENVSCYCTAKQFPRVEYDQCITDAGYGSFYQALETIDAEHNECVNLKLSQGWQLIGNTIVDDSGSDVFLIQSLWRFAQ